ncbi:Crp/Fnr family transcriptional regulator [Brevibacillus daliensis]|uniref:Crp/Fnr family transcriptional regulator n=1 Tax=Brevibacillus daliensis TaxID=2892995 RepID=UPI001E3722F0|nr:Crp/Fnr family transcriptional regulator [Brevibacillus daliensis]
MKEMCCHFRSIELCPKKVPIFQSLSDEEIIQIAKMTKHKRFHKGEALIHEGAKSDTLFIINRGRVKLSKLTLEGKEQILHLLTSGDFFCELHVFNHDELSNFSAYALTDTDICMLTKSDMDHIMKISPVICIKLLKTVTKRLAQTEKLAHNLATKDPEVRIAYLIIELCEKYGKENDEGIVVNLPITREEMANYVGVTRETVSRKLSRFEELGLIVSTGNKQILVKNVSTLRGMVTMDNL